MWHVLGASIDLVHALLMVAWVVGLPLLFVRKHPRWARTYAVYSITFIVVSQVSQWVLGECFFTTLARLAYEAEAPGSAPPSHEWFTVRLAVSIFKLSPSHHVITWVFEGLVLVTAIGVVTALRRHPPHRPAHA
ncbi:MAG: hypothetical protein U0271_37680 [Polyangiaceae bacterium]